MKNGTIEHGRTVIIELLVPGGCIRSDVPAKITEGHS